MPSIIAYNHRNPRLQGQSCATRIVVRYERNKRTKGMLLVIPKPSFLTITNIVLSHWIDKRPQLEDFPPCI